LAQNFVLGKVVDILDDPIIGVNIQSKQLGAGTSTDIYGEFDIAVGLNDTLLFTFVGFRDVEFVVSDQTNLVITMEADNQLLEEVVVIGYGTQKKKDVTGATSSVRAADFNEGIINSPEQLIRGKVAGVELLQNDGEPGAAFTVRIRGTSTIRAGNEPLYVIDGYPVDIINSGPESAGGTRENSKSALEFLNPEDIASIDILKDASAAAIYGSRGANGVVLITTKKGEIGEPQLSYSTYIGMSRLRKKINVLTLGEYLQGLEDFGLTNNDFGGVTDWQEEVYRTALTHNHNLALIGGVDNTKYRASLNFHDQDGIINTNQYTKYSGRIRLEQTIFKEKLKLEFNLSSSHIRDRRAPPGIVSGTIAQNPTWPILNEEGNYFQSLPTPSFNHPIAILELSSNVNNSTRVLSNLAATVEIAQGLKYKIILGGDISNASGKSYQNRQISTRNGRASISNRDVSSNLVEHYLTYNKQVGLLNFTGMGGYSFQEFRNEGSLFSRGDFPSDNIPLVNNISAGREELSNLSWKEKNALQSFFGRLHLDIQNKYLLTANFRADGSTRFGANNKYGYFPSAAFAWRISEEEFLQGLSGLDDLKIRASWGLTGNQEIPNKITQPVFGTPNTGQAVLGPSGQPTIGYAFIRTANPDLQWEETRQINLGIDVSLSQGRWNMSADYFHKQTTDFLLFTRAASAPTPSIWTNLDGDIINRGWELAVNGHPLKSSSINWETGITLTKVDNSVDGLSTRIGVGFIGGRGLSGVIPQIIKNDAPLGVFFGRQWLGFDGDGNDIFLKDGEGNDVFDELGYALPDITWGWTNTIRFKNVELNFLFNGAHGHEIFNNGFLTTISKQNFQFGNNTTSEILYSDESINNNLTYSNRYLEDGSYVRLSQMTLSYQFPKNIISGVNQLQVYLSGSNLLVWTDYKGYDPEVNIPISNNNAIPSIGVDFDAVPRPISFQFGVKANF